MPRRDWAFRIRDIIEAINRIRQYTTGMTQESFTVDEKTVDAVIRNLIIVGEAAKHVPEDVVSAHPEIPWSDMAGMRDVVAHEYFGVDLDIVWETVTKDLLPLVPELERMLPGSS